MNNRGYFIIDGSRLLSSILEIWRLKPEFNGKKLNIGLLTEALIRNWSFNIRETIRAVYYFKQNEKRLETMLIIPDTYVPGEKNHWQIKQCGESLKSVPEEELQKISEKYRDHFTRAEKGLDIKLACDALILVSTGKASDIVFFVNDRDYIPLFEAVQYLGGNVYLTGLSKEQNIQKGLANLCDKYLTLDNELENIFGVTETKPEEGIIQSK